MPQKESNEFLSWIFAQLNNSQKSANVQDMALQCLQVLLRKASYRQPVYAKHNSLEILLNLVKKSQPSAQLQYQVFFCIWTLSSIPQAAAELHKKFDVIPLLLDIIRNALKEKVIRVCIATLRNMITNAPETTLLPMVGHKVPRQMEVLLARKWTDEDIKEDLEFISEQLDHFIQKISTFDEYSSEVRSGKLEWSPAHQSDHFWKENASRLNERDFELLRALARVLATSTHPPSLAVACHDIGQYVKHYPQGKKYVQDLGAKQMIMELMTHESAEVRYNALAAVQHYMSNAWEF